MALVAMVYKRLLPGAAQRSRYQDLGSPKATACKLRESLEDLGGSHVWHKTQMPIGGLPMKTVGRQISKNSVWRLCEWYAS